MQRSVRIFADDLTGAADTGVSLLGHGAPVILGLDAGSTAGDLVDLDIRDATDDVACRRLARIVPLLSGEDDILVLKVDSTLRGPVTRIVETALSLGTQAIICPAFPETGRTVRAGHVLLHGEPVDATAFGRSQGLTTSHARVPGEPAGPEDIVAGRAGLLRMDANSAEDLDRIARAVLEARHTPIVIGSGGIARALMRVMGAASPPPLPQISGPVLWVAGSAAPILRTQIARLGPLEAPETAAPGADACLLAPLAAESAPLDPSFAGAIVSRAAASASRFATIFASGGATARALLDALGRVRGGG
jgi:uncharacterized protein YgbK (DUF1537 family)